MAGMGTKVAGEARLWHWSFWRMRVMETTELCCQRLLDSREGRFIIKHKIRYLDTLIRGNARHMNYTSLINKLSPMEHAGTHDIYNPDVSSDPPFNRSPPSIMLMSAI